MRSKLRKRRGNSLWAYKGSPNNSAVNSPCLSTWLLASVVLAIAFVVFPPLLLIGLVLRWLIVWNLILSLALRRSTVSLVGVCRLTRVLLIVGELWRVLLVMVAALRLAALGASSGRVGVAIHAALWRLTVPAALTRGLVMSSTTTSVFLRLFYLHIEFWWQERLLSCKWNSIPLLELVEDVFGKAFLRIDLTTVDDLLDLLD